MRRAYIILLLAIILSFLPSALAVEVVVFERYDTSALVDGNNIHITREMRIKNVGQSPIIPGELHFRLFERRGGEKQPLEVTDFSARSALTGDLTTSVSERRGETDMSVHIWDPLLPGFHYDFFMEYDLEFDPAGIFFYEIRLPQEETTIPISNEETSFVLDEKYHVTYAPGSSVSALSGNTVVLWENSDDARIIEYSRLPLPRTAFRAVNIFWLVIIIALVGVFLLTLRRKRNESPPSQWSGQQPYRHPQQQWQQYPPNTGGGPR